ncbi:hypothetical protein MKZ24_11385 [Paenibacillus sp. FSL R7-0297]|nr:hypothetical protein [Paenibacillus sp. FSL R5-0912]
MRRDADFINRTYRGLLLVFSATVSAGIDVATTVDRYASGGITIV